MHESSEPNFAGPLLRINGAQAEYGQRFHVSETMIVIVRKAQERREAGLLSPSTI